MLDWITVAWDTLGWGRLIKLSYFM